MSKSLFYSTEILDTSCCMEDINNILEKGTGRNTIEYVLWFCNQFVKC